MATTSMETNGKPVVEHSSPSADEKVQNTLSEHNISPAEFTDKSYDPETLEIDHIAEKKLVRKLDLYIVPPVMLLYLFVSVSTLAPTYSKGLYA